MNFPSSKLPNTDATPTVPQTQARTPLAKIQQMVVNFDHAKFLRLLVTLLYQLSLYSTLVLAPLSSIPTTLSGIRIGLRPTLIVQIIGLFLCIIFVGSNKDVLLAYLLMAIIPTWIWLALIRSRLSLFWALWASVLLQFTVTISALYVSYPEIRQQGLVPFSTDVLVKSLHQVDQLVFKNADPSLLEESKITEFFNEFRSSPVQFARDLNFKILTVFVQVQVLLLWLLLVFLNQTEVLPPTSPFSKAQFINFKLPESFVWIIVLFGIAYYLAEFQVSMGISETILAYKPAIRTGLEAFLSVYFLQGMAVWAFFGNHFPEARVFKLSMMIIVLLFFQIVAVATAALGLGDLWLDLRKRIKLIRIHQDRE